MDRSFSVPDPQQGADRVGVYVSKELGWTNVVEMYLLTLTLTLTVGSLGGRSCPFCAVGGCFGEFDRVDDSFLLSVSMSRQGCRNDDDAPRYHN